jgi:hypothetical protein
VIANDNDAAGCLRKTALTRPPTSASLPHNV